MDYNNFIYILIIIFGIGLIVFVYKLDFSIKGNLWYIYLKYKISNKTTDLNEKEILLNDYLQKAGHGQLYIYKEPFIYSRFCILQKLLLNNEILYKYDSERRPANAQYIHRQYYFVFNCFINLLIPTYRNVLNINELVTYFEKQYQTKNNKKLDYSSMKVECEFVCIARDKNDLRNSFFYTISTKLNSYKNRQEFIAAITTLLAKELFKENGVLNSFSLEYLSLATLFYFNNDFSNITTKDVVDTLRLTLKNKQK